MYLILLKMLLSPNLEFSTSASFITACALYAHKRHVKQNNIKAASDVTKLQSDFAKDFSARLADLETGVTGLLIKTGMRS